MSVLRLTLRACVVDVDHRTASFAGGRVERLTPRELQLLVYLAEQQDRTVSRAELLERVWHLAPDVASRVVDTTMRRLREKVEEDPGRPDHLITAFGDGYRFLQGTGSSAPAPADDEPFVGRRPELARIRRWLEEPGACVQLVGPPGTGKTRLARRAGEEAGAAFGAGPVFVDLTDGRDLAGVAHALLHALGVESPSSVADALARAGNVLRAHGPALVVLDNCEGAVEAVGEAVRGLLAAAPGLRCILTSREPVPGASERILVVPELAVDEAVALFELQAARARPGFAIGEHRPVVETLVERLERIPLAIVLAAGRAGALSPRAMLDRLDDRFRLLQSRDRDTPPRQRTLRATLDGSWELLTSEEQGALSACSVFRGGFDLAAAEEVVARPDTEGLLRSLGQRFLLERRGDRFGGYAFVLAYAAERLAEDPDRELAVLGRHGACFRDRALGTPPLERARTLSADRANLTEATHRAVVAGRPDVAGAGALAALDIIAREGPYELGAAVAREVLRLEGLDPATGALLHVRLAALEQRIGAPDDELLAVAEELAERSGVTSVRVEVARARASQLRHRGRSAAAVAAAEAALPAARELGGSPLFYLLSTLASALRDVGRPDEGHARWTELEELTRAAPQHPVRSHALSGLCIGERRSGRFVEAEAHAREAIEASRAIGERRAETLARMLLGNLLLEVERRDEAGAEYAAALRLARDLGEVDTAARIHGNVGIAALRAGDLDTAEEHLRAAESDFERLSEPRQVAQARAHLGRVAVERGQPLDGLALIDEAVAWMRAAGDGPSEAEALSISVAPNLALGRVAAARAAVDRMQVLVGATRNPLVRAAALARRGLVERAEGKDARSTLAEIDALGLSCRASSDTGSAVEELRRALADGG